MSRLIHMLPIVLGLLACASLHARDASWTEPQKPFRIYGNTYDVGSRGLSAILVTSPQGHVLIDGTLAGNAPLIEANVRALGFRLRDIRVILNSHAHPDHAGAIAQLARDSGAQVRASVAGARALQRGGDDPDDPQTGFGLRYPAVARVGIVRDGEAVRVGTIALTAHYTPGHTPGGTSWTWRSCEAGRCLRIAYVDSLAAIAADGYRFTDDAGHPHRVETFRQTLAKVAALPCDVLITPHPDASDFMAKVAQRERGILPNPLVDAGACRAYAEVAGEDFDARLDSERARRP